MMKMFSYFFSYFNSAVIDLFIWGFFPAGGFHIVFRAINAWHLTPSSKIQFSHYNSKLYITWL